MSTEDEQHPDLAAQQQATDEPEIDRGIVEAWAAKMISNPERAYKMAFYTFTIAFLVTTLFPFYWLFMLALTPAGQFGRDSIVLTPGGFDPSLLAEGDITMGTNPGAFIEVFTTVPFHRFVFNSFLIATIGTVLVLFVASLAGYVFGRLRFRGKTPLLLTVLIVSFFPPAAFFVPLNRLFNRNLDALAPIIADGSLYNHPSAIIIPVSALYLPLAIFILMVFYAQIPDGLEDAARVEGTTRLGALFRVIVPLSAPGVATAGVLSFITIYNEYFFSSLMTDGRPENWAPMLEGVLRFQGQYETLFNLMAASSIIAVLPIAILVIVAQEKIVSGLTQGAVKE